MAGGDEGWEGAGRAHKGLSSRQSTRGTCPARGEVVGAGGDVFGDDVKVTVHSEWRLCVGGEGEALANPGAAGPRNCSRCRQVTGKARPARCSHTGEGHCHLRRTRRGLNCPTKVGGQE